MAWALQKHAGLTQRQAAERLGLKSGAAVSLLLRRLERTSAPMSIRIEKWQKRVNLLFKG
jgi:DNA-directed RNA polymerase specialized sigma24 family protein